MKNENTRVNARPESDVTIFKWQLIDSDVKILKSLRLPNGLFYAASSQNYKWAWIRDNIWEAMGLEAVGDKSFIKTYHTLFDIFIKHEQELNDNFVYAKYDAESLEAYKGAWGNRQNDAIGFFLFKVGDLASKGYPIFRNKKDIEIVQKLVNYLATIRYWECKDNGIWEENEELHASSIGACVAGLKKVRGIVDVKDYLIAKGQEVLDELLPKESFSKQVDMALLNLIFPFDVADGHAYQILENIEAMLVRERGVVRYLGDRYFSNGSEAQWTIGFSWLAIAFKKIGNEGKYRHYLNLVEKVKTSEGFLPELYYHGVNSWNENIPLGWSHSLNIIAKLQS